jgi:TetR/AcrR family transcriptional repressor of nem operon
MARPKEFDPTVALDRAMELFWEQGYEATSIEALVQAMGIQRGSLYATFGSKRDLFLATLERYREQSITHLERIFAETASPLSAIESALDRIIDQTFEHKRRWGCFVTNSSVELAIRDSDILSQVLGHRDRVQELFASAIRQGQAAGEIRANEAPEALANFLFGIIQGLRVMTKTAESRTELDDIVRIAVDSLRSAGDQEIERLGDLGFDELKDQHSNLLIS